MNWYDGVQLLGSAFIVAGYWYAARPKAQAVALSMGCATWGAWCFLVHPFPLWMFLLEFVLGGISIRNYMRAK